MQPQTNTPHRLRLPRPEGAKAEPCSGCGKVIAYTYGFSGRVEVFCKRCRHTTVLQGEGIDSDAAASRAAQADRRLSRLESLRLAAGLRPTLDQVIEVMEIRWKAHMKLRAKRSADIATGLRFDVLSRDGFRCQYCGVSVEEGALLHVDHRFPKSKGGLDTLENLVTACIDCNLGKSDKIMT